MIYGVMILVLVLVLGLRRTRREATNSHPRLLHLLFSFTRKHLAK